MIKLSCLLGHHELYINEINYKRNLVSYKCKNCNRYKVVPMTYLLTPERVKSRMLFESKFNKLWNNEWMNK